MKFIYQYPELHGPDPDMLDSGPVADLAVAAEDAGFAAMAFTEHPAPGARWLSAGGHQTLDPFIALGHAAAVTKKLRLLTYLAVVPYRNPFLLAKAAATVDKLSGGRFILGVGTGYLKGEFNALGVDIEERNALFDEALEVLPRFWSGEPLSYKGRHFEAREVIGRPRPVQIPIPIWIGGNSRLTLRRVAAAAQGWMPLTGHVDISKTTRTPHLGSMDELAARVRELRELAGSRAASLDIAIAYTDPTLANPKADVARHREALAAYAEVGATWAVVAAPHGTPAASRAFIEDFATNYIRR
ncbi:MAG: LLM class F420-dependent oxidoreductase [Gammaproteobacteria bacterium]